MSMTDPIADLLTRIRNALHAGYQSVEVPASRLKQGILEVLKSEGYIRDFSREEDGKQGMLRITLKYTSEREPIILGLRRVSKPSLRVYRGAKEVRPVRSGLGISIVSTPKGVMTGKQARNENVGGEVLCEVW